MAGAQQQQQRVVVHLYDLSQGMAAQFSQALTGTHFGGIWHTGVSCFGYEYFFSGSHGILRAPSGQTPFGPPTDAVDIGPVAPSTLSLSAFEDYLRRELAPQFQADSYHLLDNNCNSFSHAAALFLTGNQFGLPPEVGEMVDRFRSTALGGMMGPVIDQMMNSMSTRGHTGSMGFGGGSMGGGLEHMPGVVEILPYAEGEEHARLQAERAATAGGEKFVEQQKPQQSRMLAYSQPVLFTTGNVPQIVSKLRDALDAVDAAAPGWRAKWDTQLSAAQAFAHAQSNSETNSSSSTASPLPLSTSSASASSTSASASAAAIAVDDSWFEMLAYFCNVLPVAKQFMPLDLLRLIIVDRAANMRGAESVEPLLRRFMPLDSGEQEQTAEELPYAVALMATRVAANMFSASAGANLMMTRDRHNRERTVDLTLRALLGKDARMRLAGAILAYNVAAQLPKSDEDTATQLISALLHLLQPDQGTDDGAAQAAVPLDDETEFTALMALGHVIKDNSAAAELVPVLGFVATSHLRANAPEKIKAVTGEIVSMLAR